MKKQYTAQQLEAYYRKKYANVPEQVIKKFLRKKGLVVYGAKSYNAHFPPILDRHTDDYDVLSKTPKRTARRIEKKLDKAMGGNYYYNEQAMHEGTYKVKSYVTEKTVLDASTPENKVPYKKIDGINYQKLSYAKKRAQKNLKDPNAEFRWPKEREFLKRLKVYNDMNKGPLHVSNGFNIVKPQKVNKKRKGGMNIW